ncbi:MAG: DNA photolyase [Puniceicoccaceae bacterium]|nr:MAG: DNA photolyase [Puniceicoccaceae bacterium]
MFPTHSTAALEALAEFLPRAGKEYAATRNFDAGPGQRKNVSMLSSWVRLRSLPEWTICREVLGQHSAQEAAKFIDEVCWRTYWKGWLESRPRVWADYQQALSKARATHAVKPQYLKLVEGASGIDCMDAWTRELLTTGYLHNHARMWFASIWIHTLGLPWSLGADFFLRHLLDGDAAANTLSWRWVAGLHTQGKSYLATNDNIRKHTNGRFVVNLDLAEEPIELAGEPVNPPATEIRALPELPQDGRIGLLLHEDDLSAADWLAEQIPITRTAAHLPETAYAKHGIAESVLNFRRAHLRARLDDTTTYCPSIDSVLTWAGEADLQHIVMAQPFVGIWDTVTPALRQALEKDGRQLSLAQHWWDRHFFPHAKRGFFPFKKAIPAALERI